MVIVWFSVVLWFFNHFTMGNTNPIICINEAHSFLTKIISLSKGPQTNLTMERLCKCYDGDCWGATRVNVQGSRRHESRSLRSLPQRSSPKRFGPRCCLLKMAWLSKCSFSTRKRRRKTWRWCPSIAKSWIIILSSLSSAWANLCRT